VRDFNLLATTYRGIERNACSELGYLLEQIGDSTPSVKRSGVSGLIAAKTAIDSIQAIRRLRETLHERPYEFRYLLRVIPIERVVRTDLGEIENVTKELCAKIGEEETFRVTVEKRFTSLSSHEIIEAVAANIKRKVDLTKPDWVVLIEVVGGSTGVAVVLPDDVLSVMKEKVL
jgi:tRNA acetyltransferase TAN1